MSSPPSKSLLGSTTSTVTTFLALYLTTLFSLDTWAAARASPYRAPTAANANANTYFRPASNGPAPDSYQAGMHGRGNAGPRDDSAGGRPAGRVPGVVDSRAPLRMMGSASCGACMT
ncbi:hypothetical protein BDV95DRAFT_185096 [Massariosphaeria phaeospora]|uniref:Uncharacterized protein n=1 Tax=Massariosphaeria phaeospora TaxID=100035 RepID=A0A7C8M4A0_9PLEO|nr:hypothetical protein BDV95DRAFT_185096 [Massariosphaeria phaeospora]